MAAAAGVSKSLVSLVLQNSPQVSEAKRAAVHSAIERLGYRPNAAARSLTQRRSNAIGALMNDLRNPWFVEILEGLHSTLGAQGRTVLLGDGRLDRREDARLLKTFMDMRVEGLVLIGTMPDSEVLTEAAGRLPTVVVGTRDFVFPRADVVAQDDRYGVALAVRHLVELGHRRIGHIAGVRGRVGADRRAGYEDTMRSVGLGDLITVESGDMTEEGGYQAARRALDRPERPTALIAVNDMVALGALGAAHSLNLHVPGNLSLVGYDNTYLAKLRHLSMTSVDISGPELGTRAAELLLGRMDEPQRPAVEHLALPTLAVRSSTAPPRRSETNT